MPLRRRYTVRHFFAATVAVAAAVAVLSGIGPVEMWPLHAVVLAQAVFGEMEWGPAFYYPGLAVVAGLLGLAVFRRRQRLATAVALVAAVATLAYPEFQAWYVWNVVGDHTANIGYGLLKMGLPVTVPINAALAWGFAALGSALVWEQSKNNPAAGQDPPPKSR